MQVATAAEIKPPVKRFTFTETNTIGDLLNTVNEIEKAGKPPFLKFVGSRGQIKAVEILIEDHEPVAEMSVTEGNEDNSEALMSDSPGRNRGR